MLRRESYTHTHTHAYSQIDISSFGWQLKKASTYLTELYDLAGAHSACHDKLFKTPLSHPAKLYNMVSFHVLNSNMYTSMTVDDSGCWIYLLTR